MISFKNLDLKFLISCKNEMIPELVLNFKTHVVKHSMYFKMGFWLVLLKFL